MAQDQEISLTTYVSVSDVNVFSNKYLERELDEKETKILKDMMLEHLDSYADMCLIENSGCIALIRIWAKVEEILGRPMTDAEKEITREKYEVNPIYAYETLDNNPILDLARTWI
jgi:hypothetical protein